MKRIKRLSVAVHGPMRSGVVVYDFARIVEELVLNSIDANSSEVSVAVGVGSWYVKVVDNGSGITRDGLRLMGERYATSKLDDALAVKDCGSESFDNHGEALSSISDVSVLEIVTKARGKPNGYRKIIKNCKCLFLGISDDRIDVGTTVIARDIFYNQPVRRRHMESSSKVLETIRMSVLRIALVQTNVSFKVVDVERANELLQTGPSRPPMSVLFSNSRPENIGALYRLHAFHGALKLSGYISGPWEILSLKAIQYVYINSRFICKGPIHRLLNQLAAKFDSLYSLKPSSSYLSEKRNRVQMGPTYILNIICPRSDYDIVSFDRSRTLVEFKDWTPVLACIENGITHLWTSNISHDMADTFERERKRCRKQGCQNSVDPRSPQLENLDVVRTWEECVSDQAKPSAKFSQLMEDQTKAGFLPETDCHSQSCDGSLACNQVSKNKKSSFHESPHQIFSPKPCHFEAYSYDKQKDGISFPKSGNFKMKFDDDLLMRRDISVDRLELGSDIQIKPDLKKSFLKSCLFQGRFLHNRSSTASDEIFQFRNEDSSIKKKWIDSVPSILDEIDVVFNGRDKHYNKADPFQASGVAPYEIDEESDFLMKDFTKSSLIFNDIPPDSCKQYLECNSIRRSVDSEWSPSTDEQVVWMKFQETSIESCTEFDEDTIRGYFTRSNNENFIGANLNMEEGLLQQHCFMNSVSDQKEVFEECNWEDFENFMSLGPLKKFNETDWSPLISFGEEGSEIDSMISLHEIPWAKRKCRRLSGRALVTTPGKMKIPVRSHSAPPFYKGKKICRTLLSTEPRNLNHSQLHDETRSVQCLLKSSGHCYMPPMERSVIDCTFSKRPVFERTPEASKTQDGRSPKKEFSINKETIESLTIKQIQDPLDTGQKWRNNCLSTTIGNVRHCNEVQPSILDISSNIFHLTDDSLVPISIDKASLVGAKVLNQVDKKFIAVVAGRTLAMIDQHAADERIRLEEFRHKVLSGEMRRTTYLDGEKELVLPEIGSQLLHTYAEQIQTWGWICNIHCQDTSFFAKNLDSLHRQSAVIKLLAVPCILGVNLTDGDLLEYLQQLSDTDGSSTIPPSVLRLLNSKACRGAIMFGDTLLPSECSLIVEQLRQTSLCFQCAHGRPTTVPLLNLDVLRNKMDELDSHEPWHGLQRHKLNIARCARRLSSALS